MKVSGEVFAQALGEIDGTKNHDIANVGGFLEVKVWIKDRVVVDDYEVVDFEVDLDEFVRIAKEMQAEKDKR